MRISWEHFDASLDEIVSREVRGPGMGPDQMNENVLPYPRQRVRTNPVHSKARPGALGAHLISRDIDQHMQTSAEEKP